MNSVAFGWLVFYVVSAVMAAVFATMHYDKINNEVVEENRREGINTKWWRTLPSALFVVLCPLLNTFLAFGLVMAVIQWVLLRWWERK